MDGFKINFDKQEVRRTIKALKKAGEDNLALRFKKITDLFYNTSTVAKVKSKKVSHYDYIDNGFGSYRRKMTKDNDL